MTNKSLSKLLFSLALSAFLTISITLQAGVKTGEAAPAFTLTSDLGNSHSLADFKGKFVVLEWTNHQCPFVRKFYKNGDMQKLQADFTGKGVVWLSIVSSAEGNQGYCSPEESINLVKEQSIKATARLLDTTGKVGKAYGAKTTPHMFVISPEGMVIYQGAIDSKRSASASDIASAENYVVSALDAAMSGKPVVTDTTSPYGCSVKY